MPLIQYSREFIISKRCHTVTDISVLADINVTLEILTKNGIKAVKMAQTKKSTKIKLSPKCKPLEKSNLHMLKNAVNFFMNTDDSNDSAVTIGCHGMDDLANKNLIAKSDQVPLLENQCPLPSRQYSKAFLLSRKCVPTNGEVLAKVNISKYKTPPFTQAGIKKIQWAKDHFKNKSESLKLNFNSTKKLGSKSNFLPDGSGEDFTKQAGLNSNSAQFYPLSQQENYNPLSVANEFQPRMETARLPSSMALGRENLMNGSLQNSDLENDFRKMKNEYEKQIRDIRTYHFKELQNARLAVREEFEKTLGVANTVISIDEQETKAIERTLQERLDESLARTKELEQLNACLKKTIEEKENEIKLNKLLADEETEKIKRECDDAIAANAVVQMEEKDRAKREFLQVFEQELECPICSEMFLEASILTSCSHAFCRHCIAEWTQTRAPNLNCPVCRAPYTNQSIKPFPLGQSIMLKIEDKLPGEMLVRRKQLMVERNRNRVA